MDFYQKHLLKKIETRSCGSFRNDITILNSFQDSVCTPYTSIIMTDGAKFATVKYKDHFDEYPKAKWEVEVITFHRDLMDRIRGTQPSRYRNFLGNHYITETK